MKNIPKTISDKVIYEVPMVPVGINDSTKDDTVRVYCHAHEENGVVKVIADVPGYQIHSFYTSYFTWLVHTGYITRIGDEKLVYKDKLC